MKVVTGQTTITTLQKYNLGNIFKYTIRKLDNIINITLLFGIIFTNYFKQIGLFLKVCLTINNLNIFTDSGRHGQI